MKLAAYLRVSTDRQAEFGLGLGVQEAAIKKWAKANGHRVVAWHRDEDVSGTTSFDQREGLAAALQSVCDGTVDGVVFHKLDRLARSITEQEAALAHAWRCRGRVFAADQGEILEDDPDDPMRMGYRLMVGVFSQIERAMIAKRLRDGRKLKGDRGGYAYGSPAFGYMSDPKSNNLQPHDAEADALFLMAMLKASTKSVREIARELEREGHRPKRGTTWNPGTLSRILRRMETVVEKAPKDFDAALREAREVNVQVQEYRNQLDPVVESRVTMALQRQGQGFRGVLYAKTDAERKSGLRLLQTSTRSAMRELADSQTATT